MQAQPLKPLQKPDRLLIVHAAESIREANNAAKALRSLSKKRETDFARIETLVEDCVCCARQAQQILMTLKSLSRQRPQA